ncbi:MAG: hypothetical protein BMS9Abin05_1216 [Rhodothermia bacterium]|nr:MAG: hypothetical protein BMS9Abin05_1216 [Rhodothermia bacterium]
MLLLALTIFAVLLYRLGQFDEYLGFKEIRQLDDHIMQAYDDASWEDKMADFRAERPQYLSRPYMSFGRRR